MKYLETIVYKDILISLLGHEIKTIYKILRQNKSPSHLFYRRAF